MKRLLISLMAILLVTGCASESEPTLQIDSIEIKKGEYTKDFYPDYFYVKEYKENGNEVIINGITYTPIESDYDMYRADEGIKENGTLYCNIDKYVQASACYRDMNNYSISYIKGYDSRYNFDLYKTSNETIDFKDMDDFIQTSQSFDVVAIKENPEECDLILKDVLKGNFYFIKTETKDQLFISPLVVLYKYEDSYYYVVQYDKEDSNCYLMKVDESLQTIVQRILK